MPTTVPSSSSTNVRTNKTKALETGHMQIISPMVCMMDHASAPSKRYGKKTAPGPPTSIIAPLRTYRPAPSTPLIVMACAIVNDMLCAAPLNREPDYDVVPLEVVATVVSVFVEIFNILVYVLNVGFVIVQLTSFFVIRYALVKHRSLIAELMLLRGSHTSGVVYTDWSREHSATLSSVEVQADIRNVVDLRLCEKPVRPSHLSGFGWLRALFGRFWTSPQSLWMTGLGTPSVRFTGQPCYVAWSAGGYLQCPCKPITTRVKRVCCLSRQ